MQSQQSKQKSKRGRKQLPRDAQRRHCVAARLTDEELAVCDDRRGLATRGEWLRLAALKALPPPPPPPINVQTARELSRVAGNLATISTAMRGGEYKELADIHSAVAALAAALLGAKR